MNSDIYCEQVLSRCSEPFTRTAHRLDWPGPFTRQNIEYVGQDQLLDKNWVNGNEAHLLDK